MFQLTEVQTIKRGQARELLNLDSHFKVLGQAPMIKQPIYFQDWWLNPIQMDNSLIPARSLERVQSIYAAGIRPQGWILAHETAAALPPPIIEPVIKPQFTLPSWVIEWTLGLAIVGVVAAVAVAVITSIMAWLVATGPTLIIIGLILAGIATVAQDPILICVTEDGLWIEVDRWN